MSSLVLLLLFFLLLFFGGGGGWGGGGRAWLSVLWHSSDCVCVCMFGGRLGRWRWVGGNQI